MPTDQPAQPTSVKRPYVPPALVIHGTVQTLTQGQTGLNLDQDGGGSFVPPAG